MEVGELTSFHRTINYTDALLIFFYDYKFCFFFMIASLGSYPAIHFCLDLGCSWLYSSRPEPHLPPEGNAAQDVCVQPGHYVQLPACLPACMFPRHLTLCISEALFIVFLPNLVFKTQCFLFVLFNLAKNLGIIFILFSFNPSFISSPKSC